MRLNKYLARCGLGARRKCEEFIRNGRVSINNIIVTKLATQVNELNDVVKVDNKTVSFQNHKIYVLLNKSPNYLTAVSDDRGRKTVCDLVKAGTQIFPVGRLDFDTSGVLLMMNDGELAFRLMHPRFEIEKEYVAQLNRPFSENHLEELMNGVNLDDGITAPCQAFIEKNEKVRLIIHEGRKRQVKRMFKALGYEVITLERTCFAGLCSSGLRRGEWRYLTNDEVRLLYQKTGMTVV